MTSIPNSARLSFIAGALSLTITPAVAADWPQWRGPDRDGRIEGKAFPSSLGEKALRKQWRVDLGPGYSGPVIVGDRVFTTETRIAKRKWFALWTARPGRKSGGPHGQVR